MTEVDADISATLEAQMLGDRVLTVIAICDVLDAAAIAGALDVAPSIVAPIIDEALADGTLRPTRPHLSATQRRRFVGLSTRSTIDALHEHVLDQMPVGVTIDASSLAALVESGCRDHRLVERLMADIPVSPWADRPELLALAETAGADPVEVAAHRAETAAALGDFEQALRSSDDVLTRPDHPAVPRAVRAAAVAHAHRGMTHLSAETFRFLDTDRLSADLAAATWAFLGDGDSSAVEQLRDTTRRPAPTTTGRGMALLCDGLELTLGCDGSAALPLLVQSATTLQPIGRRLVLPDSPAAIAALAAIGLGELDTADLVLAEAIGARLGGPTHQIRHLLLRAWVAMVHGQLDHAATMVDEIVGDTPLCARDDAMRHALRLGIARRNADTEDLITRWTAARECLPRFSVDLYSLMILGEFHVVASRLQETHRIQCHLTDADALLERLGQPPVWAAMYRWYGIQASFASEDPSALIPPAEALAAAASTSRVANLLAQIGQTWVRTLADDVDIVAVRASVAELEKLGLWWDAKRLAAQAAASTTDRHEMLELMQLARTTHRLSAADERPAASDSGDTPDTSHLTDREWEVAMIVLEGLTYREIGERLYISPKTVEHHVARIRRRLCVESRPEMLALLRQLADAV